MDRKDDEILRIAAEYMDYLEDLMGESGHEGYVADLINDVYSLLTGQDVPIIDVKYVDKEEFMEYMDYDVDGEDWLEEFEEFVSKGKQPKEEKPQYTLGNSDAFGKRVADSMDDLLDTYEEMGYKLDHLEHDKEYLVEKNAALVGQATELVLELGKKDKTIEVLNKTIDSIFEKGDSDLNKILFEKVKHIEEDIKLPERSTEASAGYDFYAIEDITIPSTSNEEEEFEVKLVRTGIKAQMPTDVVLNLYSRSSMAIKNGIILVNGVGVIDSDYYGNESNDGEIAFAYLNVTGKPYEIKKGDKIGQGVFQKYLVTTNDDAKGIRTGGVGSTGK